LQLSYPLAIEKEPDAPFDEQRNSSNELAANCEPRPRLELSRYQSRRHRMHDRLGQLRRNRDASQVEGALR
jgi:hypothetical protein